MLLKEMAASLLVLTWPRFFVAVAGQRLNSEPMSFLPFPYCNGPSYQGLTCKRNRLILISELKNVDQEDYRNREVIYQCPLCQGLYKHVDSSIFQMRNFDCESGWWNLCNYFYKVEEKGSQSIPFPFEQACQFGFKGAGPIYTPQRCAQPAVFSGCTCVIQDVYEIERRGNERIQKCRRCGQFYKEVWLTSTSRHYHSHYYKPDENYEGKVAFPMSEALQYGYRENT
jgi:uncharacterized C2H2 Zn-finger protein